MLRRRACPPDEPPGLVASVGVVVIHLENVTGGISNGKVATMTAGEPLAAARRKLAVPCVDVLRHDFGHLVGLAAPCETHGSRKGFRGFYFDLFGDELGHSDARTRVDYVAGLGVSFRGREREKEGRQGAGAGIARTPVRHWPSTPFPRGKRDLMSLV